MINTSLHTPMRLAHTGRDVIYSGTVIGEEPRERYVKLLVAIDRVMINNRVIDYAIPVEFYTRAQSTFLGERLYVKGRINNSKYANRPNILVGNIIKIDREHISWRFLYLLRNYVDRQLKNLFRNEHYDLGIGLILGGSGRIKKDLKDVFSRAGVLHILAVSGLHVGFVCMFAGFFLFLIPISTRIKFFIVMLILCIYAGITGFRPSVCRATLMAFLFGLSLILQRNVDGVHIINVTAIMFLFINPLIIFDVGTQLSFAAVYGIFFLYPHLNNGIIKKVKGRFYKYILMPMAVSFSAQLFVSPLLIYYFHRLPILAVISNLIIIPIVSIIIFLLFLCLIIGTFSFLLAQIISIIVTVLLTFLIIAAKFFADIQFSTITLYISPLILLLLYVIVSRRLRKIAFFSIIVIAIFFSISSIPDCVIIRASSTGTLISIPDGKHVFITVKKSPVRIAAFLARQKIKKLDYLIASNNYYSVEKEFFEIPDKLHMKRIKLGEMIIDVAEKTTILFRGRKIVLDRDDFSDSQKLNNIQYIITNGKNMQRFDTPLYGSILDQIMVDIKTVYFRLGFLF